MLRSRILTALVLAPAFVLAVLYLPPLAYALFFWCVAALGAHEWAGFMDLPAARAAIYKWLYVACFAATALLIHWFLDDGARQILLAFGVALWALALIAVLIYPRGAKLVRQPLLLGSLGLVIFNVAWVALVQVDRAPQGGPWLIWLFVLVWAADIGAYFAGRAFGKHKLAPIVSPGKTWEGVLGGALLALLLCGSALLLLPVDLPVWLAIALLLTGVSVVGDLLESMVKRATGVKDSGTLLPGHGGVLDRIDSLLAALPIFALLLVSGVGLT